MAAQAAQQPPSRGSLAKFVSTCFVAFAAVVALVAQLPGAIDAWCAYFGFWCTYDVTPKDISAFVSLGNPRNSDGRKVCLTPGPYRRLIVGSLKFVPANPSDLIIVTTGSMMVTRLRSRLVDRFQGPVGIRSKTTTQNSFAS
jgi:hypothetical protein